LPDDYRTDVEIEMTGVMTAGRTIAIDGIDGTAEAYVQVFGVPGNGLGQPVASNEVAVLIIGGKKFTALRLTDGDTHSRWMLQVGHMVGIVDKAAA
jgi:hypothetical protein